LYKGKEKAMASAFSYVPGKLKNSAGQLGSAAGTLSGQGSYLRGLGGNYLGVSDDINETAINNLLRFGEVDEGALLGNASTDTTLAYDKAWDAAQRDLTRMGINPNSGRFAGAAQSYALNRAAAEAGARNQARLQARNENFQRANTIAGLGYNYANLGMNAINSATSAFANAANVRNSQYNANVNNYKIGAAEMAAKTAANRLGNTATPMLGAADSAAYQDWLMQK
jgi:hypothetical protein